MQDSSFTRKPLAVAVAVAAGTVLASPAVSLAQDDGEVIEEIITTGIRGSLTRSMDIKRTSRGVVDAISAEDIGKFPDQNLAESLQRITGVSIDRERGEGTQVTVRGFGPEYNLVTINGRQMPTHNGVNRSFDFADLASEGVAGVNVYKTGRADVPSGGVGSTIDIRTPEPLTAEPTFSIAGKAVADTSTRTGDEITPEFSGIYLGRFADDTIGVAITGSHQVRNNGVNSAVTSGWFTRPGTDLIPDGEGGLTESVIVVNDANQINRPQTADRSYSVPQNIAYNISEYETTRTNGQLVLQWAPTEDVTATVDYIYSEFELERSYSDLSAWFSNTGALGQSSEWNDDRNASPIYYTEQVGNADFAMGTGAEGRRNENESIGFNLEWWLNDRLSLEFDYHDSSAETGAIGPNGTNSLISIASFNKVGQTYMPSSELPILVLDLNSGGEENRPLYKNDMRITGSVFGNDASLMELEQAKIAGSFEFSDEASIDFGVQTTEVSNRSQSASILLENWGGMTDPGEISDILVRSTIKDQFDQLSGHNHPDLQREYFTASLADLQAAAEAAYVTNPNLDYGNNVGDCGTGYCGSTDWTSDLRSLEESTAVYLQFNWSGDFGSLPVNFHMGVRHEQTDVTSAAREIVWAASRWQNARNEFTIEALRDENNEVVQDFLDVTGDYDFTLPNIDFDIEPWEDIVLRASFSETITRPSYEDIKGGLSPSGRIYRPDQRLQAASGNPGLVPIQSENIDLSFEWYYGEGSYFSIGYFEKNVENFIGSELSSDTLFDIPNIIGGELWNQAIAEGGFSETDNEGIGQYIIDNFQDSPLVDGNVIVSGPNDPPLIFDIRRPINEKTANVDGVEINLQHAFGDSGYGFIVNAPFVDADVAYDDTRYFENQFVLNGLSDSANLIGFYDGEDLQIRLAYNWRDDFIAGVGQAEGTRSNPTNVKAYGQLDLGVTYYWTDNLTMYFSGLNITDETRIVYGLTEKQVLQAVQTGARWDLGIRYNFDM
ncbi:MAG: TonB-dependent receptor [Woeseiaceae bacterium]